jgi:hypothetical protein
MRIAAKILFVACLGGLLMFVAHFGAFLRYYYAPDLRHVPYWWAYVVLYPLGAVLVVQRGWLRPLGAAAAICLLPAMYFLALGVLESNWTTSSTAILGVGVAFVVAVIVASWTARHHHRAHSAV